MPKENKSMHVVLGILSIGPMSGYDISLWIKTGVGYFWKISYNQIYPALEKFVAEGLATYVTQRNEGRPERKVYTITEKGLEALKKWLIEPIDYKNPNGNELLLKLFFGSHMPAETALEYIKGYREYVCRKLAELKEIEALMDNGQTGDPTLPYRHAVLLNGLLHIESTIKWCDQAASFLTARMNEEKQAKG